MHAQSMQFIRTNLPFKQQAAARLPLQTSAPATCLAAVALTCASICVNVATPLDRTNWKISLVRGSHLHSEAEMVMGQGSAAM